MICARDKYHLPLLFIYMYLFMYVLPDLSQYFIIFERCHQKQLFFPTSIFSKSICIHVMCLIICQGWMIVHVLWVTIWHITSIICTILLECSAESKLFTFMMLGKQVLKVKSVMFDTSCKTLISKKFFTLLNLANQFCLPAFFFFFFKLHYAHTEIFCRLLLQK